ncbi:MAG: hypothetical protein GOVbin556_57 [Prokaryotic dsDNA virus sp.]|nr:MAG: hypothetical protein GOVbin556_57 [Prokaryotic dsDNA virus sp.]|tara:strand:- start:25683 stop:25952 length:270 start_codon:yes stop_codon:yes gene_type:complete
MSWKNIIKISIRERASNPDYQWIQNQIENMETNIRPFITNKFWKKKQNDFVETYKIYYDKIKNAKNRDEARDSYNEMVMITRKMQEQLQ